MSKRQKGRKHRTVNRTPRPRGAARPKDAARPVAPSAATPQRFSEGGGQPVPGAAPAPVTAAAPEGERSPGTHAAGAADAAPGTAEAVFATSAREGGLGRNAERVWERLRAAAGGVALDDLAEDVGFTAATVRKHLTGLVRHGLAEQRGDRWCATGSGAAGPASVERTEVPRHATR